MELIQDLPLTVTAKGPALADLEVTGVSHDSRRVNAGDLFVAVSGERHDGRSFASQAVARGAVAVLAGGPPPAGITVPWLVTPDPRGLMGPLAGRLHGHPDRELVMVGVTGTNGKSTVASLLAATLERSGRPAGLLGTLGYRFRERRFDGDRTTPEAPDLFAILRRMRDDGAESVAMEVSSHALELGRVGGVGFDLAVFTNLTRDHLDFHRDLEEYFAAKRRLFGQLKAGGRSAINVDDPYGRRLAEELGGGSSETGPAMTFGESAEAAVRPLSPETVELDMAGIRARLATPRGELEIASPLLGRFNLANLLAAVAGAEALELPRRAVVRALAEHGPLPGRLERVDRGRPLSVFLDYAHTDGALAALLASVREIGGGRPIVLVFGCGGDRDAGKRPLMGRVAGELAHLPIVTSDNPRGEDPLAIIAAVERGLKQSGNPRYRVVPDRREAIRRAIAVARPEAVVVVAGKGHEQVQIVAGEARPFSDRAVIEEALEERFGPLADR